MCKENITGIFFRCILAPKGCRGGQKKYNVNIKKNEERKGRKSTGFVHPCIHAPSSHHTFFLSSKHILKSSKRKIRAHRGRFSVGLTLLLFQKAFMLCLSMLKSICRFFFGCRPFPRDWSRSFSKRNYICKKYMFLGSGPSTW